MRSATAAGTIHAFLIQACRQGAGSLIARRAPPRRSAYQLKATLSMLTPPSSPMLRYA